tara:strand:+ start:196 stop:438 length:243 start_codon:yes stop_codon:yes gene_type:complete
MLGPGEWTFDEETQLATCSKLCPIIDENYSVTIEIAQYTSWKKGEFIQQVMPELSSEDREFLISGMTPAMWDNIFGEIQE